MIRVISLSSKASSLSSKAGIFMVPTASPEAWGPVQGLGFRV